MSLTPSPSDPQAAEVSPTAAETAQADERRIRRRILWICIFVALVQRIPRPNSDEIEHFDEGVYASNLWFGDEQGSRYPDRHLYAPPLLPGLSEYCQLLMSTDIFWATLPVWMLGAVSVFWIGKLGADWINPHLGFIPLVFVAFDPLHTTYSRSLMTDVPMTACLIVSVWLAWRGLSDRSFGFSIAAGVVCGIGWSFKYSGWLPLAIAGSALAARSVFHVKRLGAPWREWGCWLAMVVAAGVTWLPAWLDLQEEGRGGYAAVAANHAQYFQGFSGWWERFERQIANATWYEATNARLFVISVVILSLVMAWGPKFIPAFYRSAEAAEWPRRRRRLGWMIVLAAPLILAAIVPGSLIAVLIGYAVIGVTARVLESLLCQDQPEQTRSRIYATWFLASWLASMLLATPFYHPYPRLLLPLLLAVWLGVGAFVERIFSVEGRLVFGDDHLPPTGNSLPRGPAIAVTVFGVGAMLCIPWPEPAPEWNPSKYQEDRTGLAKACRRFLEVANELNQSAARPVAYIAYTWAEPAVFYQLSRLGPQDALFGPITDFGFVETSGEQMTVPIVLITGPHAERDPTFQAKWPAVRDRFELVGEFKYQPSDMVLLDEYPPAELAKLKERPKQALKFYLLMPKR